MKGKHKRKKKNEYRKMYPSRYQIDMEIKERRRNVIRFIMTFYGITWIVGVLTGISIGGIWKRDILDTIYFTVETAFVLQMVWVLFLHLHPKLPTYTEFVMFFRKPCLRMEVITAFLLIYPSLYVALKHLQKPGHLYWKVIIIISVIYTLLMIHPKRSFGEGLAMWMCQFWGTVYILGIGGMACIHAWS